MFVRQDKEGKWYLARITSSNHTGRRKKNKSYRNWWLVKEGSNSGQISIRQNKKMYCLVLPKQFIGKKIRLRVEVIQEANLPITQDNCKSGGK